MANRVYLEDIVKQKRKRVAEKKFNIEELMSRISQVQVRPSFYEALAKEGLAIIGEVKKASPSKGLIKPDFRPLEIAKEYENCVEAISVLTEEDFFLGQDAYLETISGQVALPTLCKDFIIDANQIYQAKALGASAVLLIVAILTEQELTDFQIIAESIALDVLVEVHTKHEVERALQSGARIIGINNRDLKSFKTDIMTTVHLRKWIPEGILVVSESGIDAIEDIKKLKGTNIHAILVGESFMRSDHIKFHAREFKNAYND